MDSVRIAPEDLNAILEGARPAFERLQNARIFLTGGSGFFGKWLIESFLWANHRLNLKATLTVLSRDPEKIPLALPHLAGHPSLRYCSGDISSFLFPSEKFTHLIHGAAPAVPRLHRSQPLQTFQDIVHGTQHTLEFARHSGVKRFLLLSSGAVYGPQSDSEERILEDSLRGPQPFLSGSCYSEGKRAAEFLAHAYQNSSLECVAARCFTFVGPHIPLNHDYAAGDFIRNTIHHEPIQIQGDGTAIRSYLYTSDLCIWLWTLLTHGKAGEAYNVGSEYAYSIETLAQMIQEAGKALGFPAQDIRIAKKADSFLKPSRYLPCTQKIRTQFGVKETVSLSEALHKTLKFYSQLDSPPETL